MLQEELEQSPGSSQARYTEQLPKFCLHLSRWSWIGCPVCRKNRLQLQDNPFEKKEEKEALCKS